VQRERGALDFEQCAGVSVDEVRQHSLHPQKTRVVETDSDRIAVRIAPLGAMQPRHRQIGHAEKSVDAVDAAPRNHRHGAMRRAPQRVERSGDGGRHDDAVGRRSKLDERSVEIEEECRLSRRQKSR